MDPVAQTLAQQDSGSAQGQGFGQFFVAGQQAGLARRRLALEQQQESRMQVEQNAMLPLHQAALALENQQKGIAISTEMWKAQALAQSNQALPQILALEVEMMQSPDGAASPEVLQKAVNLSQKYPFWFGPGQPGDRLLKSAKGAVYLKSQWQSILEKDKELEGKGSALRITGAEMNPATGETNIRMGVPARSAADMSLPEDVRAALAREQGLEATGLNTRGQMMYGRPKEGERITVTSPDGTVFTREVGKPRGSGDNLPQAVTTKAEEAIVEAKDLFDAGRDLMRLAKDSSNVGIRGNVARFMQNWGGQAGLNFNAEGAFNYETATALFKAKVVRALKSDGNITQTELNQLLSAVPTAKLGEDGTGVNEQAQKLMRYVARSARTKAERTGRPLPLELMTPYELRNLQVTGQITLEQARDLIRDNPFIENVKPKK